MATSEHSDETGSNRGSDASTLRSRPHTARQGCSASIICRPAASSAGSGNTFLCKKCLQTFPVTERDASRFGSCAKCGTAYKGLTDRWKINRSLKVHYDAKSEEDRAAWYKRQHALVERGIKQNYDELMHEDITGTRAGEREEETDQYEPFEDFETRKLIRGMSPPDIADAWKAIVDGGVVQCRWARNQWLPPRFAGVAAGRSLERFNEERRVRGQQVESAEELRQLNAAATIVIETFRDSMNGARGAAELACRSAPATMAVSTDVPLPSPPVDVMARTIEREVGGSHQTKAEVPQARHL